MSDTEQLFLEMAGNMETDIFEIRGRRFVVISSEIDDSGKVLKLELIDEFQSYGVTQGLREYQDARY